MTSPAALPRVKLAELVALLGTGIEQDAGQCVVRLKSECGLEYGEECTALAEAVDAGIVAELRTNLLSSVPRSVLLRRLSQRLAKGSDLPPYLAQWSVECWALAFGIVRATDDLLSLKLERLAPLLDAAAADGTISTESLDHLLHDAGSEGLDEATARAYIARYVARRGWRIGGSTRRPAPARQAPWEGRPVTPVSDIPETGTSSPMTLLKADAAVSVPPDRQQRRFSDARLFRWVSGMVVLLVAVAAIATTAIDWHLKAPPSSPSPSVVQPGPTQANTASTDDAQRGRRAEELRRTEKVEREQGAYNAARGKREALQAYIGSCEICAYRDAALQEKARLDAADQEEQAYRAARGSKEALQAYIHTCTVCAYKSTATEEKARIDATIEQEERTYIAARGNKYALQAYINTCSLCARRAAAQSEIATIEAAQPRRITSMANICGRSVDFVIEATGVPETYRAFLGVWTGAAWNSRICGGLIVRRIESDGTADVIYIYGPLSGGKFPWKAQHPAAMASFKQLTFTDDDGSSFIFTQTYDNTLHGYFSSRDGTKLDAIFTRDLSSVP